MTEQERAAALADEIERHGYSAGEHEGFDLPINIGEDVIAFLRLLAATPAASSEVRERVARAIREAPMRRTLNGPRIIDPTIELTENELLNGDAALSAIRLGDRLPAGVVVPKEPTEAMVVAGDSAVVPILASLGCRTRAEMAAKRIGPIYRAMIAAIAAAKETTR